MDRKRGAQSRFVLGSAPVAAEDRSRTEGVGCGEELAPRSAAGDPTGRIWLRPGAARARTDGVAKPMEG